MNDAHDNLRDPALSRLYRQASQAEPPPALDAAILAAAREAAKPQRLPHPWWRRLQVPLALAATAMLAVVLTLSMDRNPLPHGEFPAARSGKETPPAAEPVAPKSRNVADSPAAGTPAPKEAHRSPTAPEQQKPTASSEGSARQASPTAVPGTSATSAIKDAPARSADTESAGMIANERRKSIAEPAAGPALEARGEAVSASQKLPEVWLEEIRSLRRQGRLEEAERSLRDFRAAYPEYLLPKDLH